MNELLVERVAERGVVVAEGAGTVAGAGVEGTRRVAGGRQLEEALVLMDRHGGSVGRDFGDVGAGTTAAASSAAAVSHEGEHGVDFRIFGEGLGRVEVDGRARGVDAVRALLHARQRARDAVDVAQEEVGSVDHDGAVGRLRGHGKSAEHRRWEGLFDRKLLVGVGRRGTEALIRLDQQNLRSDALEVHDQTLRGLAAVKPKVVRSRAVGQRVGVEQVRALAVRVQRNFKVELTCCRIPVERQQARHIGHAGRARGDGRDGGGRRVAAVGTLCRNGCGYQDDGQAEGFTHVLL